VEVVVIFVDGALHGLGPTVLAEGLKVFVLGERDGLAEGLGKLVNSSGGFGVNVALCDRLDGAAEGSGEIAGGEIVSGEEIRQILAEVLGGLGLGFPTGVGDAEVSMVAGTRSTATASVGEGVKTHVGADQCGIKGHEDLLNVELK
jgi:hypothetical protein